MMIKLFPVSNVKPITPSGVVLRALILKQNEVITYLNNSEAAAKRANELLEAMSGRKK